MATCELREKAIILHPDDDVAIAKAPIKLATNSLVYRSMEEDMDINCGVILEGTPLPVVGRQILDEAVTVASGKRTKSEALGIGEEEFAPWIIGPVL